MRYHPISFAFMLFVAGFSALAADLVVVRHGISDHNLAKKYNSNPEHPNYQISHLTDLGREQARKTAEKLIQAGYTNESIGAVYVSPLPRAQETAKVMAEAGLFNPDKMILDMRLIDNRAGDLENTPSGSDYVDTSLHGETQSEVISRVLSLYDQIAAQNPEKHVIFVSHSTPAAELIESLTLQRLNLSTAECMVLPLKQRDSKLRS